MEADWTSGSIRSELKNYNIADNAEKYVPVTPNASEDKASSVKNTRRLRMSRRERKSVV